MAAEAAIYIRGGEVIPHLGLENKIDIGQADISDIMSLYSMFVEGYYE